MDSGATSTFLKSNKYKQIKNFKNKLGKLHLADNRSLDTIGEGRIGKLKTIICPQLASNLLSVKQLTKDLNYHVYHVDNIALILLPIYSKNTRIVKKLKVIAKATIDPQDGLYHVDMSSFVSDNKNFNKNSYYIPPIKIEYTSSHRANETKAKRSNQVKKGHKNHPNDSESSITQVEPSTNINLINNKKNKVHLKGSTRSQLSSARAGMNLLEWLHVRLGHLQERKIKRLVKNKSVKGLGVTYEQIRRAKMRMCFACKLASMKALPIYPSINDKIEYKPFECIHSDWIPLKFKDGTSYKGFHFFVDQATTKIWLRRSKSKKHWVEKLKQLMEEETLEGVRKIRYFCCDFDQIVLSKEATEFFKTHRIKLRTSAPYKKQQNYAERIIQIVKNAIRTSLIYNKAPIRMGYYAAKHYEVTYNNLPRGENKFSRNDEFYNNRNSDVSRFVPFFSLGVCHMSPEERSDKSKLEKAYHDRARIVRMVGYPDQHELERSYSPTVYTKDSFLVYCPFDHTIKIRHDCHFQCYSDSDAEGLLTEGVMSPSSRHSKDLQLMKDEKQLMVDYEEAFGRWKSPEWFGVIHNNDPVTNKIVTEEPLMTIVPSFDDDNNNNNNNIINSESNDNNTTNNININNNDNVDEPVKVRFEIDDYGFVKPTRVKPNLKQPIAKVDRPKRDIKLSSYYNDFNMKYNKYNQNKVPVASANLSYIIVPQTTSQKEDELFNIRASFLNKEYKKQSIRNKRLKEKALKSNLETFAMKANIPIDNNKNLENKHKLNRELESKIIKVKPSCTANLKSVDPLAKDPNEYLTIKTPNTLFDAFMSKEGLYWYQAWIKEMERIEIRNTYDILPDENQIDESIKAIKSKYAFRLSLNPDGSFKFKVRLVACGYSQVYGKDFLETFSPTAKYRSFTTIMHLAAIFGWDINGLDVENAFIETDIDIPINMYLPADVYRNEDGSKVKVRLNKSLYGLKQAGELFYKNLRDKIINCGYKPLIHDKCIYIKRNNENGEVTIAICYVDDVIITGNNPKEIRSLLDSLSNYFTKINELGNVTKYVGVEIDRNVENNTLKLHQKTYIDKVLHKSKVKDKSTKQSPLPVTVDYKDLGDGSNPEIRDRVGQYRFLADRTRPSILFAVGSLGSAAHKPSINHLRGCDYLDRYLIGSKDKGVTLGGKSKQVILFAYSDASYIAGATRLGYCFFLNLESGTIFARSTKSNTVSHSSAEAEIKAIDECIRQITWMRGFLDELGYPQLEPTIIYTDNIAAKYLADKFNLTNNSAHMVTRLNYIHQEIVNKNVELKFINTENQVADILTKLLPTPQFLKLEDILLNGHKGSIPVSIDKEKEKMTKKKKYNYKKAIKSKNQNKIVRFAKLVQMHKY